MNPAPTRSLRDILQQDRRLTNAEGLALMELFESLSSQDLVGSVPLGDIRPSDAVLQAEHARSTLAIQCADARGRLKLAELLTWEEILKDVNGWRQAQIALDAMREAVPDVILDSPQEIVGAFKALLSIAQGRSTKETGP